MLKTYKYFIIATLTVLISACASNESPTPHTSYKAGLDAYNAKNYGLAFVNWEPLAKKGNKFAQFGLAQMYDNGQGTPQNHNKAYEWYLKAAKQGYLPAQTNIGRLYAAGEGVGRDYRLCYVWSSLAATSGMEIAVKNREECKTQLDTDDLEDAQELAEQYWIDYNQNP